MATLFRWAAQKQTSTPCLTHAIIWESGRFLTLIPSVGSKAKPSPIKNAHAFVMFIGNISLTSASVLPGFPNIDKHRFHHR